ncbi:toprim domain-containing protein [Brevibacillus migulae]|uniref:toprim domain-containing protein n=1 Tax=Brevibacillus migulae TaxID=1644114 RepID=UPI00106E4213|nr:toprim domain-containing protein [Brevibacillus migulae]
MDVRVMIVEGKTDRERLRSVLDEPVTILCTYGTFSAERAEELREEIDPEADLYIFTDEDDSGKKLRKLLREEFPDAIHLHTRKEFAEVADTPLDVLAEILERAGFLIKSTSNWE